MKIKNHLIVLLVSTIGFSPLAFAEAFPRVRNSATERLCADPNFFDSIAVGQLCRQYYQRNGWGIWGTGPYFNDPRDLDRLTPDRQFDRLGRGDRD